MGAANNLNQQLLEKHSSILPEWFPEGKLDDIGWYISPKDELSVNISNGFWVYAKANGEGLVSLYSHLKKVSVEEALEQLRIVFPDPEEGSLIDKFGKPYYLNDNGQVTTVNEPFWAGYHFLEHIELFEPDERWFYRYDQNFGLYKPISEDIIKQEISQLILNASRKYNQPSLEKKRTDSILKSVTNQLRGIAEKKGCFIKRDNLKYVHLANGVLVFNDEGKFELKNFSPDFYSRNQSPIPYIPEAKCEKFLNELLYPAVSKADAILIQKYIGMCLLGLNIIQRFLILEGLAGRGKTQLALIIQLLIGLMNCTELRTEFVGQRFEIYRYLKKTLLIGVDVSGNFLSEKGAQKIKGLVGGDWYDAEQKGGTGSFPVQGRFNIVITANTRLHIRLDGDVGAWHRRFLIVPFKGPAPAKKIPGFAEMLIKEEGSGILNFALEGLLLLLEDAKALGDVALDNEQIKRIDTLLSESDSIRHFLIDRVEKGEGCDLTVGEIVHAYADYCPAKGWVPKPPTIIFSELEALMLKLFQTPKSNSIRRENKDQKGFRRVRFKPVCVEEEE